MDTRWWVLFWCCVHSFFGDFFSDEPSVLVQRLVGTAAACTKNTTATAARDDCLDLNLYQFNLIISVSSWASAVAAICSGIVVDRQGSERALWVCAGLFALGGFLFAVAAYSSSSSIAFAVMLVGRLISGFGGGGAVVIMHRMKATWFLYQELALSFSVHIFIGRLGSAMCFLLVGYLLDQIGLRGCLWLGFGVSLVAAGGAIALAHLDQRAGATMSNTAPSVSSRKEVWTMVRKLDGVFWCCVVVIFFYYGSVGTFTANGPNFLAMEYGFSEATASYLTGIVYDMALLAPLSGWLTDRYGYREYWFTGTAGLLFFGFILLYYVRQGPPWVFIIFIGLGYTSFGPTAWSSIPLIVPPDAVGLATGTGKFFHFIGVGSLTAGAGAILDMTGNRRIVPWEAFFIYLICASAVCILVCGVIIYLNRVTYYRLTPSQRERDQHNTLQEIVPLNVGFGAATKERRRSSETANAGAFTHD